MCNLAKLREKLYFILIYILFFISPRWSIFIAPPTITFFFFPACEIPLAFTGAVLRQSSLFRDKNSVFTFFPYILLIIFFHPPLASMAAHMKSEAI